MRAFDTVGIVCKDDPRLEASVHKLRECLRRLGCKTLSEADVGLRAELGRHCQLIVVVGGDGTLLSAARDLAASGVPLLGINLGRLGFTVDVNPADMEATLGEVVLGEFALEQRLLLSATLHRADGSHSGPFLAVNDAVIRNQAAIRMLEFETWLGKQFISQHRADGFIVSSPTGSTAYALSGGGPVLHPALSAFALVPICPHTLSDRPIVVGADSIVRVVLRGDNSSAMFTCDGQTTENLTTGDAVEIAKAAETLRLVHPRNYSYFEMLRSKLHWGRRPDSH